MTIRVVLIEDHPLALRGMLATLAKDREIDIVGAATGEGNPLGLVREEKPDVIVFDVNTKLQGVDPVTMVVNLKRIWPSGRILVLMGPDENILLRGLIHAGARGCMLKTEHEVLQLRRTVHRLHEGELIYPQEILKTYFDLSSPILTPRELEVLRLAARGMTSSAIGEELGISDNTVRNYLSAVYEKLGVSGDSAWNARVLAINRARRLGLL
jgi:DNA-binding NarL/FixJ family response regulator